MRMLSRRSTAVSWTACRGLGVYGAVRYARGRLSAKRSARARIALVASAGIGLVAGVAVGVAISSRGGCDHDHDHAVPPASPSGD